MDDNSGVGIGGDGSVAWNIKTVSYRKGATYSDPTKNGGYAQGGIADTEDNKRFLIGIKIPRTDGQTLARSLYAAAKEAEAHAGEANYRVIFPLAIEPKNEDQITITWDSVEPGTRVKRPRRLVAAKSRAVSRSATKVKTKPAPKKKDTKAKGKKKR